MAKRTKRIAYVVPHTHWDREWRYPIWKNRMLLAAFMDELLDTLERDEKYRSFVMDGQSVIVEDYLQVRPENADRLRRAVQAGRLAIGPWYSLPDLYPIDGECLVRNLLRGVRLCGRYGGHMAVGYNSFGWGQTAQFPQIYAGFGIDFIIAAKRVSKARAPGCEFLWASPDGTRVLTTRLGTFARANVYFNTYIRVRFGVDCSGPDYRYDWRHSGIVIHNAAPDKCHEDHFKSAAEEEYHAEEIEAGFRAAWEAMDETALGDERLLMDGSDFTDCQPILTRMLADANEAFDDIEFVHGTLEQYAARLRERLDVARLPVVEGEMRDGPANQCSANALATRAYLKVANKHAQNVLLRRAEPLAALLAMMGEP
jgi:mannosylglycerate hydrolase